MRRVIIVFEYENISFISPNPLYVETLQIRDLSEMTEFLPKRTSA